MISLGFPNDIFNHEKYVRSENITVNRKCCCVVGRGNPLHSHRYFNFMDWSHWSKVSTSNTTQYGYILITMHAYKSWINTSTPPTTTAPPTSMTSPTVTTIPSYCCCRRSLLLSPLPLLLDARSLFLYFFLDSRVSGPPPLDSLLCDTRTFVCRACNCFRKLSGRTWLGLRHTLVYCATHGLMCAVPATATGD